jgi:hypothetical protein
MQLAVALRTVSEAPPLIDALDTFGEIYQSAVSTALLWRLGFNPLSPEQDRALIQAIEPALRDGAIPLDRFFFDSFAQGIPESYGDAFAPARTLLAAYTPRKDRSHAYWRGDPCSMLIDEVETLWSAIDERDDWAPLNAKIAAIRQMGEALA